MDTKPFKITIFFFFCLLLHITSKASSKSSLCNGSVAKCKSHDRWTGTSSNNMVETVIMESWSSQRMMEEQIHKLSYGALRRNLPACDGGKRGESYSIQCLPPPSNPYSKGCSKHYRCRRDS